MKKGRRAGTTKSGFYPGMSNRTEKRRDPIKGVSRRFYLF
jgi:hypothetical protein